MKVAIVEDDGEIAKLYEAVLSVAGFEIVRFTHSRDALVVAAWRGVDVAVVDLMMPDVDGVRVVRFLYEHAANVRRVVASALEPDPDVAAIADATLRKPFSPDALLEAIREP